VHTWDSEWDQEDEQEPYDGRYGNYGHDMEYEQQPPQRVNQGNRVQGYRNNQAPQGVPQFNVGNMGIGDELQLVDGVPQIRQRAPVQGVDSHFRPVIVPNSSAVVTPVSRNGRAFEVRPQDLGHLPEFYGKRSEEPYLHISAFESVCNMIGGSGFTKDQVMLMMFQFTLKDMARQWFATLPPGSIYTWQDMQQIFLEEYYTMSRTSEARDAIRGFQQNSGEAFHEAFTRFKELLRKSPHHGIQTWELIKAFYDGLTPEDVRGLTAISNGTFFTNTEAVDWGHLERMSATSKRQAQSCRKLRPSSVKAADYEAEERIEKLKQQNLLLAKQVAQLNLGKSSEAKAANAFSVCTDCGELGDLAQDCQGPLENTEEVNQVYGERKQYDMNSNTYHPGLKNHPNFRYGNPNNQLNPNFSGSNVQGGNQQQSQNRQYGYNQGGYSKNTYNQSG
jgi:hypothetical protein